MAKILEMPKLSPTMEEGVLSAWHKKEGDAIGIDDLLAEVETDKATMEFRSFDKGTIRKLLVAPGSTVKLGQAVAILGEPGEDIAALEASLGAVAPVAAAAVAAAPVAAPEPAPVHAEVEPPPPTTAARVAPPRQGSKGDFLTRTDREPEYEAPETARGEIHASPAVRKAAREQGIDLAGAVGSGPHGRVILDDLSKISAPAVAKAPVAHAGELRAPKSLPLSPMRKTIARRLVESKQTVPHFYLNIDIDAGPLVDLRESINRDLASAGDEKPLKISVNDLIVRGCAIALKRVPECNAQFTADAILLHERIDISVAVAVPDGLVTPVVRDANEKSVTEIGTEVRELAGRAKNKKLKPEEMQNGTFSISNLGMFGIDSFAAVINPPEGAILAVGQVRDEPVVKDGSIIAGKKLAMTLSCDHRVIDGAVGARFLAELRALLTHPLRLLA
jgi:pyruvate dehydrogenase E2 component (dihydrolipoamide acetyltransferase)